MWKYLKLHEAFVRRALGGELSDISFEQLRDFHQRQIARMQHERMVHLIVTLAVIAYWLGSLVFVALHPGWAAYSIAILLLLLVGGYLLHYFRLENGVQRWYHLANAIDEKLGLVSIRCTDEQS